MQATRIVLTLVLVLILGVSFYFIFAAMQPDDRKQIAIAFGNPDEEMIEMHIEMTMSMAGADSMSYLNVNGNIIWANWAAAHYVIQDSSGQHVALRRTITSNLISEAMTRGYNDSFLVGKVKRGEAYTFDYIPVVGGDEKYHRSFTAPTDTADRLRMHFDPVK
jgi:hypothetical protein